MAWPFWRKVAVLLSVLLLLTEAGDPQAGLTVDRLRAH